MAEQTSRNLLDCTSETYWRCVYDEQFNRRLYLDVLKFRDFKWISLETTDDLWVRKMYLNPPKSDLPAPIASLVGDLSWNEEGRLDRRTGKYRLKIETNTMRDKTSITGEIWCEARGETQCDRFSRTVVDVKVFMVGSMIEKRILDDLKRDNEKAMRFTNDFVREKGW